VAQSGSTLSSDASRILITFPYACDDKTFTISTSHFSPFKAFGIKIVKPLTLAIPSPPKPLSIISTIYFSFFFTGI